MEQQVEFSMGIIFIFKRQQQTSPDAVDVLIHKGQNGKVKSEEAQNNIYLNDTFTENTII